MRRHALARCRCRPLTARILRFQPSTDVSGQVSVKSSVQRSIRASILSQWQINPETFEQIWPKKESLTLVKWSVLSHRSRSPEGDSRSVTISFSICICLLRSQ